MNNWTRKTVDIAVEKYGDKKCPLVIRSAYSPNVSRTLDLVRKETKTEAILYVYDDEFDAYKKTFGDIPNLTIKSVDTTNFTKLLVNHTNYIMDDLTKLGYKDIIITDDDVTNLWCVEDGITKTGNHKGVRSDITWHEYISTLLYIKYELYKNEDRELAQLCGMHGSSIGFVNITEDKYKKGYKKIGLAMQNILLDLEVLNKHNIRYRDFNGEYLYEDFVISLEILAKGLMQANTAIIGFDSEVMDGGTYLGDDVVGKRRQIAESTCNYIGLHYSKIIEKKGVLNSRLQWQRIRKDIETLNCLPKLPEHFIK